MPKKSAFTVIFLIDGWISNKRKTPLKKLNLLEQHFQEGLSIIPQCIVLDIADVFSIDWSSSL